MSFKVGDLVKLHERSLQAYAARFGDVDDLVLLEEWRGRVIDLYEAGADDVWGGTELGDPLANVAPPIMISRRDRFLPPFCCALFARAPPSCAAADSCSRVEYTTIPVGWLEVEERPKRPKSAAKGRSRKKGAEWKAKKQETLEAIELQKDDEDDAWFLDARAGDLGDDDADFHDAADTREKTLSAAAQSDLAQARSGRGGGRGRRRRRKRTRRTRRRKKRRTRRRRRKRTRRRRRR
jgi:hypothetical protein